MKRILALLIVVAVTAWAAVAQQATISSTGTATISSTGTRTLTGLTNNAIQADWYCDFSGQTNNTLLTRAIMDSFTHTNNGSLGIYQCWINSTTNLKDTQDVAVLYITNSASGSSLPMTFNVGGTLYNAATNNCATVATNSINESIMIVTTNIAITSVSSIFTESLGIGTQGASDCDGWGIAQWIYTTKTPSSQSALVQFHDGRPPGIRIETTNPTIRSYPNGLLTSNVFYIFCTRFHGASSTNTSDCVLEYEVYSNVPPYVLITSNSVSGTNITGSINFLDPTLVEQQAASGILTNRMPNVKFIFGTVGRYSETNAIPGYTNRWGTFALRFSTNTTIVKKFDPRNGGS